MPCDSMSGVDWGSSAYDKTIELKKAVDELTAVFCEACRTAEDNGSPLPPVAAAWWAKHKAYDKSQGR